MAKGTALSIVSLLIGVSGLGLGTYSILNFQVLEGPLGPPGEDGLDGVDGINRSEYILLAIWENLNGSGTSIFLGLEDNILEPNDNYTLSGSNRSIILNKPGWYRLTIRFLLQSVDNVSTYQFNLMKNSMNDEVLDRIENHQDNFYQVNVVAYTYSDGDDIFMLWCYTTGGTTFYIYPEEPFNQVVLEYIGE